MSISKTFRLDDDEEVAVVEDMQRTGAKNFSTYARDAMLAFAGMDPHIRKTLQNFATHLGMKPSHVLTGVLSRYFGEMLAHDDVHGPGGRVFDEFVATPEGMIPGKEQVAFHREKFRKRFEREKADLDAMEAEDAKWVKSKKTG